jgi:hypothetical protein
MSARHGRPTGRFPRPARTAPPHCSQAKAARKAQQRQLSFSDEVGPAVAAAFGGGTCCFCGVELDGFVRTFDGRLRCMSLECGSAERRAERKAIGAG